MNRKLAWVTGAGGLIGHQLIQAAPRYAPGWEVRGLTRADFDLADFEAVTRAFTAASPQLVIHCAALSRSPDCEANPTRASFQNVEVTRHLCGLAKEIPFFFFSTDLVFDGRKGSYVENDAVNPLSVYARTKVEAEAAVLACPRHTVIRTSLNGGVSPSGRRGFNEEMRHAWQEGRFLPLFTDEFRSPIPAAVTARAVWELAARGATGLFHIAGGERLSRWEIGQLVATRWPEFRSRLERGSLRDYRGAPRPPDTSLNCAKAEALLGWRLPGLGEWLRDNPNEPF
jgi:dTDP-4-dehydrorhamnose reductase